MDLNKLICKCATGQTRIWNKIYMIILISSSTWVLGLKIQYFSLCCILILYIKFIMQKTFAGKAEMLPQGPHPKDNILPLVLIPYPCCNCSLKMAIGKWFWDHFLNQLPQKLFYFYWWWSITLACTAADRQKCRKCLLLSYSTTQLCIDLKDS